MCRYQYSPLSDRLNDIRLIRLLPAEIESAEIRAELLEYSLAKSRKLRHSYEALSYVWGDANTPRSVLIGDDYLHVTPNLHAALIQLRDANFPRIIWIDAICINQADTHEKELQIQSMAKIYGMAKRVVVWLGEAADGSDEALAAVRAAGIKPIRFSVEETISKAIMSLLQRQWFKRIWVLQEVAAARHVVIICGSAQIDGHAFSTGLSNIELSSSYSRSKSDQLTRSHWNKESDSSSEPDSSSESDSGSEANSDSYSVTRLFGQARAVVSLIRGAIFRPEFKLKSSSRATLDICTLGELMTMYNAHQATQRHDKIYALIGMASDDIHDAGLSPDYSVLWEELQRHLFCFLLGKQISVKTWPEKEGVEIKGRGRVLGHVKSVMRDSNGDQNISIVFRKLDWQSRREENDVRYSLRPTTNSVCNGDIIYLLDGAPRPMIIRSFGVVFHVISMAPTSPSRDQNDISLREIILIWDWAKLSHDFESDLSRASVEAKSYWNAILVLAEAKSHQASKMIRAITRLVEVVSTTDTREHTRALAETEVVNSTSGMWEIMQPEVLDLVRRLDSNCIMQLLPWIPHEIRYTERVVTELIELHDEEVVAQMLLERKDDEAVVTEEILLVTLNNQDRQEQKMKLLLDHKSPKTIITEVFLVAAASKRFCQNDTMQLLLKHDNDNVHVTELVLMAAARSPNSTLRVLLDHGEGKANIPEAVLVAVATESSSSSFHFFLDRYKDNVEITEAVLLVLVGTWMYSEEYLEAILNVKPDTTLQITENVLCAVAKKWDKGLRTMKFLYANEGRGVCFPDGAVTHMMLQAAAGNTVQGADTMKLLLDRMEGHTHITSPVIEAARGNGAMGNEILSLLSERSDEALQICQLRQEYSYEGSEQEEL